MKLGNSKSTFTILLTQEEYNEIDTKSVSVDFKTDSLVGFLHIYKLDHPHKAGRTVSIIPNSKGGSNAQTSSHPWRILISKSGVSDTKWRFLNTLPLFSPEQVSMSVDGTGAHWIVDRPAMTTISPQAKARQDKALQPIVKPGPSRDEPKQLPKPAPQLMTREEYSDSAMYKALNDGLALVNKAMLHYGDRLTIDVSDKRIRALLEINGD